MWNEIFSPSATKPSRPSHTSSQSLRTKRYQIKSSQIINKAHRISCSISIRRAFTCESKSKNCSVSSTESETKSIASPSAINFTCTQHHCSSCSAKGATVAVTAANAIATDAVDAKKPKIHIKKPLLKSIILSTNNSSVLNIKREPDTDTSECDRTVCPIEYHSTLPMTKTQPNTKLQQIDMQFTNTKKTKQINSTYFKSNQNYAHENARSYSPPLPANHPRLASIVSSDASNVAGVATLTNNQAHRRSHSSRDQKCSKKRKKRRRSYSRDSRSRWVFSHYDQLLH